MFSHVFPEQKCLPKVAEIPRYRVFSQEALSPGYGILAEKAFQGQWKLERARFAEHSVNERHYRYAGRQVGYHRRGWMVPEILRLFLFLFISTDGMIITSPFWYDFISLH